jgi:hypothetical protein
MPEHLANEIKAVAAGHGDRGEAMPKVMNAEIFERGTPPGRVDRASGCRRNVRPPVREKNSWAALLTLQLGQRP